MTELSTINLGKIEAMKQALMIYCFFLYIRYLSTTTNY